MSFELNLGDGRLNDCEIKDGVFTNFNSYARVVSINQNVIQIENLREGEFNKFDAGENILLHVSATNGVDASNLGRFFIARIELVDGDKLTLDKNVFDIDLNFYYVQIVSIPQFKNLTLKNTKLAPTPYDAFKFTGGMIVAQVYEKFEMINSDIDLTECGIPTQKKMTYRPLTEQEQYGETDGSKYAGEENLTPLILNSGDGAVFIQARNFICDEASRIGNPKTHGRSKCRGAADSIFKPSNITNIGGSSVFIAAENLKIQPVNIAKYRSSNLPVGRGLCRCKLVSENLLPNDEKLYNFDIPANVLRVQNLGIYDFGDCSYGTLSNPQFQLNNFAQVSSVEGNKFFIKDKTLSGLTAFKIGALVIVKNIDTGEFRAGRIFDAGADFIVTDAKLDGNLKLIVVPEFESLEIENYTCASEFAVACNSFNLTGTITAGGDIPDAGYAQSWNKLHGIFILSKNVTFGENAKLDAGAMIICETLNGSIDFNFIYRKI